MKDTFTIYAVMEDDLWNADTNERDYYTVKYYKSYQDALQFAQEGNYDALTDREKKKYAKILHIPELTFQEYCKTFGAAANNQDDGRSFFKDQDFRYIQPITITGDKNKNTFYNIIETNLTEDEYPSDFIANIGFTEKQDLIDTVMKYDYEHCLDKKTLKWISKTYKTTKVTYSFYKDKIVEIFHQGDLELEFYNSVFQISGFRDYCIFEQKFS